MADTYLDLIKRRLPDLPLRHARILPASGQFNTVVCIDQRWIFRFPKSEHVAADLARELEILPRLQGKLPLPIPDPVFSARDSESGQVLFMGYAMLPGEALLRERFSLLRQDAGIVARIAQDLADFFGGASPDFAGRYRSGKPGRRCARVVDTLLRRGARQALSVHAGRGAA